MQGQKIFSFWSQAGFKISAGCTFVLFLVIFFLNVIFFWGGGGGWGESVKYVIHVNDYWNQTKFHIHKVWCLREATQIGQTFITLCE